MSQQTFGPLAVFGGGAMAEAIIRGGIAAGVLDPTGTIVCDPNPARRQVFDQLGVRTTTEYQVATSSNAPILLAVKPQSFGELAGLLRPHLTGSPYVAISILAGTTATHIHESLGQHGRIVRAMPNTAAALRASTTALARGPGATADDLARADRLFAAIGITIAIDEQMMDAATAVAGSGPAYIYYLAQAMIEGAVEVGFDPSDAGRIVRTTIAGAAAMLQARSDTSPENLRAQVTSKRGTTAAAIATLDQAGVLEALRAAIIAARDRGRELAQTPKQW